MGKRPPWIKEIPAWVDRVKPCYLCEAPIRIIHAKDESGEVKPQIVDAEPHSKGWVRVWLNDRSASVVRKVGTISGDPYIPFKRHSCPERRP